MLKCLIVSALIFLSSPVWAQESSFTFKKSVLLWELFPGDLVPSQIGAIQTIDATLHYPELPGSLTRTEKTFREASVLYTIQFFWVRPSDTTQSDYWVTQTKIEVDGIGIIAQCSRFNEPVPSRSVGIGACSGRLDQHQIGVTIQ